MCMHAWMGKKVYSDILDVLAPRNAIFKIIDPRLRGVDSSSNSCCCRCRCGHSRSLGVLAKDGISYLGTYA
jgi:hypothetical protein